MVFVVPRNLGPMEFVVAPLVEDHPDPELLLRLAELVHAGGLRVMDVVVATRIPFGSMSWSDIDGDEFSLAGIDLAAPGLISEQDIQEVLGRVAPGGWAIVLIERTWDSPREHYRSPGATVISVAHVPADVAEAVLDDLGYEEEDTTNGGST